MTLQYQENPLVFLNSNGPSSLSGRNVRSRERSKAAQKHANPNQTGYFGQIQLNGKRDNEEGRVKATSKRRKATLSPIGQVYMGLDHAPGYLDRGCSSNAITISRSGSPGPPLDPSEILAVATFHIRRIAAMTIQQHPERLRDVLRCRQWSCVSVAFQRFGRSQCLDAALLAVAAKLRQITGGRSSSMIVLSSYTEALHELQNALQRPSEQDNLDLLTTTQLLAVYEMLDSLDEETWAKHVAGAISLAKPLEIISYDERRTNQLTFARAAPIFTDALLSGNEEVLHGYPWERLLKSALQLNPGLPEFCRGPMLCLIDLPELLEDASVGQNTADPNAEPILTILDRAHALKARLRTDLLQNDLYARNGTSALESFDLLGMCLAVSADLQSTTQDLSTTLDTDIKRCSMTC